MKPWRNMGAGLALLFLLAVSLPAVAQNPTERFQHAQQLIRDGNLDDALQTLDALRADYPQDVDYVFSRALVLERLGRDEDALIDLEPATQLAPDYEDVWRFRFVMLSRQAVLDEPSERESLQAEMAQRFPEASWWRSPDDTELWTLLAGVGLDTLSNGLPNWNQEFFELSRETPGRHRVALGLSRNERYNNADYSLRTSAQITGPGNWYAGAGLSIADSASFQPDLGYNAYVGKPFAEKWVFNLAYRRSEYADTTVSSVVGTVEKYHEDLRFASSFASHAITTNWYFRDNASIGVTVNHGQEAESLGNGRVLESDVSGLSISGRYQINQRYGLQWWLGSHEQGDFYRRQSIGMAVSIRL